ncbi:MAG: DUF2333 family protein [Gammaproteobacteria bacterium]|nr:DUF2333 family protein [Gammaproteobacteria bacterium]
MPIKIFDHVKRITDRVATLVHPGSWRSRGVAGASGAIMLIAALVFFLLAFLWGQEPDRFEVHQIGQVGPGPNEMVTGYMTSMTLARVARVLLEKPGGYLSNDVMLPGVMMDNVPNWEYGVLVQVRDLARSLRNDMSRSQSQSVENKQLSEAEPLFNFDNSSWLFPPSEQQYRKAIRAVTHYANGLSLEGADKTQFFARADNLRDWLAIVEKRLGSLSQRLSASVGQTRINTDLAGDAGAVQSGSAATVIEVKTPWLEIDDVFYEARGATWALIHFMQAIEVDFADVLKKKNARISLQQIVRELEGAQEPIWSPVVLNGRGFGFVTNYSLIMASYISRANAAVIDLRNLLAQG